MTESTLNLATAWEAISDEIGDQPALSCAGVHTSWAKFDDNASRLAMTLSQQGLTQDSKIVLYLYNGPEYSEAQYAAFKIRGVPANANYRYLGEELAYILNNAEAEAIFFDHTLADRVEAALPKCPQLKALIQVGGGEVPSWAISYEEALSEDPMKRINRTGEDLWFLYTGGTTGMPKAVMWDHHNIFGMMQSTFRSLGATLPNTPEEAAAIARQVIDQKSEMRQLCAAPLMHGTSGITGMITHSHGGLVATLTSRSFDPDELWTVVEQEKITMVSIVGDAFAKPMVDSLDKASTGESLRDVSSLRMIFSSGVMFSDPVKERLLEYCDVSIVDSLGSSEGTGIGNQITSRSSGNTGTARFVLGPHTRVFTDDGTEVKPGSKERGRLATGYPLPLGYFKDPEKTAATFPEIDGRRWSIAGDYAVVEEDGTITLLGRGSVCINTGGEKVYPEEVEEALKTLESVRDCNVVGLEDDRWGQAVTAVVQLEENTTFQEDAIETLKTDVRGVLAGYKVPKEIVLVPKIQRSPNGKTDYKWAKETAETLLSKD